MKSLILYVHGSAEMYGSDKVLLNLAQAEARRGVLLPVVVLHEDGPLRSALELAGVEVHVGHVAKISRAMFSLSAPWVLARQMAAAFRDLDRAARGRPLALVYSNTLAVLGGAVWAWRRGHRHVWHVHEILLKPWLVCRGLPWMADLLSDQVISNSRQTETWLLRQAPGLKARSSVVFNGLAPMPEVPVEQVAQARHRLCPAPEAVLATVAGRLNHWKGQGLLLQAVAQLRDQGRLGDLHVAVVGDVFVGQDHIKQGLMQQVQQLGLQDRVQFIPFVADIVAVWRASDIAVVPSLEPEPFGMVAIEAMACGLPVIAARHGGLLDIVVDNETGLLFEPGNAHALAEALYRLVVAPELRARFGRAGQRRQAEAFSLQTQVDSINAICLRGATA